MRSNHHHNRITSSRRTTRSRGFVPACLLLALVASLIGPAAQPPAYAAQAPAPLAPIDNTYVSATGYAEPGYADSLTAAPLAIPEFSWHAVSGATSYRVQFSQNIGFSPVALEATTPNTRYTPVSSAAFTDGNLYWRVRVDAPAASNYSSPVLFVKDWASPDNDPALSGPANGAELDIYNSAAFSWEAVTGAARYRFQIASSAGGFGSPLYNTTTLATSHQPLVRLENGVYYWRVVPLDPNDRDGTPSAVRSFTLAYGQSPAYANEIPTLLEPADGSFPTFTPSFHWTAVRGAQFYRLQYSTDPTFSSSIVTVDTRNPVFTPTSALPNDINYYWRVQAHAGSSISEFSETWGFVKKWYIQPELLTPANNYQYVRYPFFSWTPVPGAARYRIEVSPLNTFPPVGAGWTAYTANPFHLRPDKALFGIWYWRVTPMDNNNNLGLPSSVFSFNAIQGDPYDYTVPQPIQPLFYYAPSTYPPPYEDVQLNPFEDRSVALPIFSWHRAFSGETQAEASAYRIVVDDSALFTSPNWTVDTVNTQAAPTEDNPFNPTPGTSYYWRVCALDGLGGTCETDPGNPALTLWSQRWKTRFDPALSLANKTAITLLRPANGAESVEQAPLLEWWPLQGAATYEIEISTSQNFTPGYTVDSAAVEQPAYVPTQPLDYSPLEFGTYYWRVRGLRADSTVIGSWSSPWRFQVAAGSRWIYARALGDAANRSQVGADPDDVADNNYELTTLSAVQDADYWYFGFNAATAAANMSYVLYLDLDHASGSGAPLDAEGYAVTAISVHRPEYAIYVAQVGSAFSPGYVAIYRWTGSSWADPDPLDAIGGDLSFAAGYLEFRVPSTHIGMEAETGSLALALFSVNASGQVMDALPAGGLNPLNRFASVSERMNLVAPPNDGTGDPATFPSVHPLFWDWPVEAPWEGYQVQVATDQDFTSSVWDYTLVSFGDPHLAAPPHTPDKDLTGDNTYYWRVRPIYNEPVGLNPGGAWSQSSRFERQGFIPQNLTESVTFATPTFTWDMVEGAAAYDLQVDSDSSFGSPEFGTITTAQNSYTPLITLDNGQYYWRVRVRRYQNITNDWTAPETFTLTLPKPSGLAPHDPDPLHAVDHAPTLCWNHLSASSGGVPVLTAWKYRVQVSNNSAFGAILETAETEQKCWTTARGYADGTYYWRVAMMDGQGRLGDYSAAAVFTKQYPVPTLVSPLDETVSGAPTYVWTPVNGASAYKLEVSLSPTFSTLYESVTTNNARYTPTRVYNSGLTYYWRVAILDKDAKPGPFTDATLILDPTGPTEKVYLPAVRR
jgi:hypothetical protein